MNFPQDYVRKEEFLLDLRSERHRIASFWITRCSLSTNEGVNEPVVWRPVQIPLKLLGQENNSEVLLL